MARAPELVTADLERLHFLLDELASWARDGLIDEALRDRLAAPYQRQAMEAAQYVGADLADGEAARGQESVAEGEPLAEPAAREEPVMVHRDAAVQARRALDDVVDMRADHPSRDEGSAGDSARARGDEDRVGDSAPARGDEGGGLLDELRPVFYENFILFVGAFLVFAGSIYFAIFFWRRLGDLGPLVAGGFLAAYAASFSGAGYFLQRRYKADLAARVLYAIATAILPVSATLVGEPLQHGSVARSVLGGAAVTVLCGMAYPGLYVAAALFQREVARPLARALTVLVLSVGFAPLVVRAGPRVLAIVYLYVAMIPLVLMYRRVRGAGWIFERATVIYVVAASSYALLAVAVRLSLTLSPAITLAEVAPLLVVIAAATIDLDLTWRQRSHAVRTTLGVVGVLGHAVAILAIIVTQAHPVWRVLATLAASLLFAVSAVRHRRPAGLHLSFATLAAGVFLCGGLPFVHPPAWSGFAGLLILPLAPGLARLAARWQRHGASEFAAPCHLWTVFWPCGGALVAVIVPALAAATSSRAPGLATYLPALVVLPACTVTLALVWSWGRRRLSLIAAALTGATTLLVIAHLVGARELGLSGTAAGIALGLTGAAFVWQEAELASKALVDAAAVLLAAGIVLLVSSGAGPWQSTGVAASVTTFALTACAALAVAAVRPHRTGRLISLASVIALAAALAAALYPVVSTWPGGAVLLSIVALALLAPGRRGAALRIGAARPLRDAYLVALAALVLHVIQIFGYMSDLEALPPLEPALAALALCIVAARQESQWPTCLAFVFCLAAAYATPAALGLAVRPYAAARACGLTLVFFALALCAVPRLRPWRRTFLDVPLHFAALAAPLAFARLLGSLDALEPHGAVPDTLGALLLVLRRFASPLALCLLAAIMHGSRVHAYLAITTMILALPGVAVAHGSESAVIAALAGAGLATMLAVHGIVRLPALARPIEHGDRPLAFFGLWRLPSAASMSELFVGPLRRLGALAGLAALTMTCISSVVSWPDARAVDATSYALLAGHAVLRCAVVMPDDRHRRGLRAAVHVACACISLLAITIAGLSTPDPDPAALAVLAAGFVVAGELLGRHQDPVSRMASQAAFLWAIGLVVLAIALPGDLGRLATPLSALLGAAAVTRYSRFHPRAGLATLISIAGMAAAGFLVLFLLGLAGWLAPEGTALAALALTASLGAWAQWLARARLYRQEPYELVAAWALLACLLALVSTAFPVPLSCPALVAPGAGLVALLLALVWFVFAALRTGRDHHGYLAQLVVLAIYVHFRLGPLGAGIDTEADAVVAIAFAFALHFIAQLLRRAEMLALGRPATVAARFFPLGACVVVGWNAVVEGGHAATLPHALLAESIAVLYTLGLRRGGPRILAVLATLFFNLGLFLLWIHSGRSEALYYTIPVGASIVLLAHIYRGNLGGAGRRGLRAVGCAIIYFSTYYQAIQFDDGLYPVLLGGLTLIGMLVGFRLRLRDLFLSSAGFLVLDVVSNLAYYGVHRPVLGWTLLTVAGLGLTASGVFFQLRRAELRAFMARSRSRLREWD